MTIDRDRGAHSAISRYAVRGKCDAAALDTYISANRSPLRLQAESHLASLPQCARTLCAYMQRYIIGNCSALVVQHCAITYFRSSASSSSSACVHLCMMAVVPRGCWVARISWIVWPRCERGGHDTRHDDDLALYGEVSAIRSSEEATIGQPCDAGTLCVNYDARCLCAMFGLNSICSLCDRGYCFHSPDMGRARISFSFTCICGGNFWSLVVSVSPPIDSHNNLCLCVYVCVRDYCITST